MADRILSDIEGSGIYQIRNLINGKRYIGSAKRFRNRWAMHRSMLRKGIHHSKHLQNSWNKRGENSFAFEILETCAIVDLISTEQRWIDTALPEYNCYPTAGSPLGFKHSPEFCKKVSERFKGKKLPQERVEQMKEQSKRRWQLDSYRKTVADGIKASYTDELKQLRADQASDRWADNNYRLSMVEKISASHHAERRALTSRQSKARWADPAYKARLSEKLKGREISEAAREKIRASLTGRPLSVETRRKKSALTDDQVRAIRIRRDGGAQHKALAVEYGVSIVTIARICRRQRYQWVTD